METNANWVANLHPLLVHFPIALLFTAMAIELAGLLFKQYARTGPMVDILIWSGTFFGLVTLFSGLQARTNVPHLPGVTAAVAAHALIAKITVAYFFAYSLIRIARYRTRNSLKPAYILLIFLIGCIGLIALWKTGDRGGKLVYKFGAGTDLQKFSH